MQNQALQTSLEQAFMKALASSNADEDTKAAILKSLPTFDGAGDLLSNEQAAQYLGVSISTLNHWRAERIVLPYVKVGKRVMYKRTDLEAYVASRTVEVAPV